MTIGLDTGFKLAEHQSAMLAELKQYLDDTFPPEHEGVGVGNPEWSDDAEFEWVREYNRKLHENGWLVPHWPERYGGRGLTAVDQMLIREELAYRRIPIANANGLDMLAPILLRYGTEEQCERHLPRIAAMDELWCQGYSEPDHGSDLTHLRTTAIRDGDTYIVNGSKVWTGHGAHADWMILLCRTNPEERGSKGLSLLMVDLRHTDGVEIHPIRSMTGAVTFCQEYFTDAKVPVSNRVGPENGGWAAAQNLLDHERAGIGNAAKQRRLLTDILAVASTMDDLRDSLAVELGHLVERVEAARTIAYEAARQLDEQREFPSHLPSVLKLYGAQTSRRLVEAAAELLGLDVARYHLPHRTWDFWQEFMLDLPHSIAGGSNEIQRDIIAARHLGISR